jgi:hypothetical protein
MSTHPSGMPVSFSLSNMKNKRKDNKNEMPRKTLYTSAIYTHIVLSPRHDDKELQ